MKLESLITTKKRQLDKHETQIMLALTLNELYKDELPEEITNSFLVKVLTKRLEFFKIPVNKYVVTFIVCLIVNPGQAVMWAYALNEMYKEVEKEIDLWTFCLGNYFGNGIPTDEEYNRIWLSQKVKDYQFPQSDNALDDPEYWK